jgi:hypothetical protein
MPIRYDPFGFRPTQTTTPPFLFASIRDFMKSFTEPE